MLMHRPLTQRVSGGPQRRARALTAVAATLILTLWTSPTAAAPDMITDLGTFPGGLFSFPGGVNAQGKIVGNADTLSGSAFRAFLWDQATGMQNIGTLFGGSAAHGINSLDQVVGKARTATGFDHAFFWSQATGMSDLGTLGGSISAAYAVNTGGQVVGESTTLPNSFAFHAFLLNPGEVMLDLGTLPGGSFTAAYAINDSGQVVGEADVADGTFRAFIWTSLGGMQAIAPFPGGTFTTARGINGLGKVVGWGDTASGGIHAFLWDPVSGMQDLGTLSPGAGESFGFGINDQGQVVGQAILADGFTSRAFLWDPATGMRDLGILPGGSYSQAVAINSAGHVMGQADNSSGLDRAVRWQINRPPLATGQAVSTAQDTPLAIVLGGSDPDQDPLAFTVVAGPAQGTLSGTPPNLTYTPQPGFSGGDSFTYNVSDGLATGGTATVSITVTRANPPQGTPGRMHGHGHINGNGWHHHFEFHVGASATGEMRGRLHYRGRAPHSGGQHHGQAAAGAERRTNHFVSSGISAVAFVTGPALASSRRHQRTEVGSALFTGIGVWNKTPNCTFEAQATDAGEPGRGRDSLVLTIKDPSGAVMATVSGVLAGGNIQYKKPK